MCLRKRLEDFRLLALGYGLTLAYVESDDPQLTDDEIDIYRGSFKCSISIQIGQCGHFYVNEHIYQGEKLVAIKDHGEYRALVVALTRALDIASKEAPPYVN